MLQPFRLVDGTHLAACSHLQAPLAGSDRAVPWSVTEEHWAQGEAEASNPAEVITGGKRRQNSGLGAPSTGAALCGP